MVQFFLNIYDFLQARRRLCMSMLAVVTVILLVMVSSLKYNENVYDFLPISGNEQKAITLYQDITGGQRIFAMFSQKDGERGWGRVTEAVDTFSQKIQSSPGKKHISELTTQIDFEKVTGITTFVYENMPLMLTDSDYVRMEHILSSEEAATNQLAAAVQLIMMPATGFFTSSISNDPLGLFTPVTDRLQGRQSAMTVELDDGYIFTPGGKYAVAMLTSPYGAMESANNNELVSFVDSVAHYTMEAMPDVEVSITGSPVIAVGNASQIKTDSQWAISIAVTLILLLLVFSFRKVKNLLLIGVAIIFGWLFAMGFIAVMRSDVSLIVLGIGSIIIGIAVNYPLHFIAHTDHGGTVREVLKEMVSPLLIGNITTVGAFASLMPLDAPALRDLGFFAAFMLIGTILFVLIFLPHLVKRRIQAGEEHLVFGKLSSMSPERHRWLLWIILILTPFFGYFSLSTSFDTNMHHINYMTADQERLLSDLRSSAGLSDTANVYVVSEGDTWDEALQQRRRIAPLLDSLKTAGRMTNYTDVTAFVCDSAEQQRRIDRWNTFWDTYRDRALDLIARKSPAYGFRPEAFTAFTDIVTRSHSPQSFDYFEPLCSVILNSSFSTCTGRCSVVDVIDTGSSDIPAIETALNEGVGNNGYAFDFTGMNSAIAASLSDDFNYIGFACGFIVFVFLWLSFGRLELSLLAFLPMAMGWLWILGMMYLFGMQFNIVNVILATFIFGQGDDYTIFITDGLINEYAYRKKLLPSYKNSIVISALIMFIGMGSLIVAKHPALHSLAEVTIVGMFTVVLMAWIVPPLIFNWMVKRGERTRLTPITIEQLLRTGGCITVGLLAFLLLAVGSLLALLLPKRLGAESLLRRAGCMSMRAIAATLWGVDRKVSNSHGEDFSHGSIAVCNHQSVLDTIFLLALHPHILVMTGDRLWNNPVVRFILKGLVSTNLPADALANRVANGYSVVVMPKSTSDGDLPQTVEETIRIAADSGADILPVYLHGTGHVMPKGSSLIARGQIDLEVGQRIPSNRLTTPGDIEAFRQQYADHYKQMKEEIETTHYFHHYTIYKYTYKGIGIEKNTRRLLKQHDDYSQQIDGFRAGNHPTAQTVSVVNAQQGQFALLFALVHPDITVNAYAYDPDDAALAACCDPMPANLHVFHSPDEQAALSPAAGSIIIHP